LAPSASFPSSLRGFGPVGIVTIIVILLTGNLAGAALVLIWASVSGTRGRDLGFVRPPHGAIDLAIALVAGVVFKILMKALVMPLLGLGAVNSTYHYLSGNTTALLVTLLWVIVGGGFGEELIWRGFLFERLGAFLGPRANAKLVIVVVTSILFALAHYWDQGVPGAVQATMTGLVFGTIYARIGTIWPVMVAHAAFDVAAVLMIYWNLEEPIGQLFLHLR
jgi:membrane protease YdiL (CAAX protease family)